MCLKRSEIVIAEGDEESSSDEDDGEDDDDDEEDDGAPWNSFLTSNLGFATGVEDAVFDNEAAAGLPLTGWAEVGVAGTVPNDFTPSVLMGGTEAGDEDIGAETSSIEPKVTAEPGRKK